MARTSQASFLRSVWCLLLFDVLADDFDGRAATASCGCSDSFPCQTIYYPHAAPPGLQIRIDTERRTAAPDRSRSRPNSATTGKRPRPKSSASIPVSVMPAATTCTKPRPRSAKTHLPVVRACVGGQPQDTSAIRVRRMRLRGKRRCSRCDQHTGAGTPRGSLWRAGAVRPLREAGTHRSDAFRLEAGMSAVGISRL